MNRNQSIKIVVRKIINARYSRIAKSVLDEAFEEGVPTDILVSDSLEELARQVASPIRYPQYTLPIEVIHNRDRVLPLLSMMMEQLKSSKEEAKKTALYELFVDGNWIIRYATQKWFLLTPGLSLEMIKVSNDLPEAFREWLSKKYKVTVTDSVVHRHVISNQRRESLKELGFDVPYLHWDKSYYVEAMKLIKEIVISNPNCKGILSDGSWTYNPKLYETAPDGKPFASFAFLSDDRLVGDRFFLEKAVLGNDQENQFLFATRSERRKRYVEEGILDIDVYGVFYPRERLLSTDFENM